MKYIPLDALVAKIERRFDEYSSSILKHYDACKEARAQELGKILTIIGTLEVKEMGVDSGDPKGDKSAKYIIDTKNLEVKEADIWHLQEKEDIYNAVKDWSPYAFACIMKDGTIQRFTGIMDEDCDGHINVHIVGVNDSYDNVDDIVKWIEIT